MKLSIIFLRIIHGVFAVYFLACLTYMYVSAITGRYTFATTVSVVSLAIEGFMVFVLNKGDCPLIHIQKRIGDPVPFFNLIFPAPIAKRAIPAFSVIAIVGFLLLVVRFVR